MRIGIKSCKNFVRRMLNLIFRKNKEVDYAKLFKILFSEDKDEKES
jgi:hypothetical protein